MGCLQTVCDTLERWLTPERVGFYLFDSVDLRHRVDWSAHFEQPPDYPEHFKEHLREVEELELGVGMMMPVPATGRASGAEADPGWYDDEDSEDDDAAWVDKALTGGSQGDSQ